MTKRLHELDAYLANEHADPDAFEEAMFDAPDDPDLAFFDVLATRGARLVAHGTWEQGWVREQLEALVATGRRVQIEQPTSANARIDLADDAEFLCTKLPLGRTDLDRVDVEIEVLSMGVSKTIRDVIVDQREGIIYGMCERPLAQIAYGAGPSHVKVRERGGERRVIAEWRFNEHLAR